VRYRQAPDVVLKAGTDPDIRVRYRQGEIVKGDIHRCYSECWDKPGYSGEI
jgi:hypothetical protein